MIFLGIDYGLQRTGLALSDPAERLAFPAGCLRLEKLGTRKCLFDKIAQIAAEKKAGAIVLGLPLREDGTESETTRQVRNAAQKIARRANLPIYQMPEILSSLEAALDLRASGLTAKKARQYLDEQAACRILQSFLEQPQDARRLM